MKRPLDVPYYSVQEQTGSWGLTRTTVDATDSLTDDKIVTTQNAFIGPTITYHPIEQFRFNLDAEYQNTIFVDNANGFPAVGTRPAPIPISRYLEDPAVSVVTPIARKESSLATTGPSTSFRIGA